MPVFVGGSFSTHIRGGPVKNFKSHEPLRLCGESLHAGAELLGEFAGTAIALYWVLLKRAVQDFLDDRGQIGAEHGQQRVLGMGNREKQC